MLSVAMIGGHDSFVGRARELAELESAIAAAKSGSGGTWLIWGEPGIGKSRLVEEAMRRASDATCAFGRSLEIGGAPAYWPWTQVFRTLLRKRGSGVSIDDLGSRAMWLRPIVQELEGDAPAVEPEQARFRLFDAAASVLLDAAEARPLVIALEDVHAADAASLHLLEFVARQVRSAPIALFATVRSTEAKDSPVLARIAREGTPLVLGRLDREAVARLLARALDREPPPELADDVFEKTEGHPLFLREVILHRLHASHAALPRTLADAIGERLAGLAEKTRRVLECAAILGREFDVTALAAVLEVAPADLTLPLGEAVDRAVCTEIATGTYRFSHALVSAALRDRIDPAERASLHARAASAVERSSGSWEVVAHHRIEAGARVDAIAALRRAGEECLARWAFDQAAAAFARALPMTARDALRFEVLLELARARMDSGDARGGREACREAVELARSLGSPELLARGALASGSVFLYGEIDPSLVALLEEARGAVDPESALGARVLARLAAALQPAKDPRVPIAMARRAIETARTIGDDETLLDTLRTGISAMMDLADPRERLPYNREHVALAEKMGRPLDALRGHMRLVFDCYETADAAGARRAIDAAERIVTSLDHSAQRWKIAALRAMQALHEGRVHDAEALVANAAELAEPLADPNARRSIALHRFAACHVAGRWDEALRTIDRHAPMLEEIEYGRVFTAALRAAAYAGSGRADEAAAIFPREVVALAIATADTSVLNVVVTSIAAFGSEEDAATLSAALEPHAHRFVSWGILGMAIEGPVATLLGRLARRRGRDDEACAWFERAIELAATAEAPLHLAWAKVQLSELLRLGDPVRARALASDAGEIASRLSNQALLQRLGAMEAPPLVPSIGAFSMHEEGGVWTFECDGARFHLKDVKGLRVLARLVGSPGREIHVLELEGIEGADRGDHGEAIDVEARDAYRARVHELREQMREAEAWNDRGRVERAAAELEAIEDELARSVGLGGRLRRSGSAAERARVNAQRRLRDAIRRIEEQHAGLGRHLSRSIRTGTFCSYTP
jgi:tetratricopeptide (TPR) repeat protein